MRVVTFLFLLGVQSVFAQTNFFPDRPKVVVGIVVDQMRQEYIYRYWHRFGDGGFKRLVNEGFMMKNGHYNYMPTYTGPGHASVYTGTTPAVHGIIGNDWYDKNAKKMVYCAEDQNRKVVGAAEGEGMSPWRMLTTTVTDELELATQRRSKVIGISIKDRGAILPAGHTPDGAYWYDDKTGKFISSNYYKSALPVWLDRFNARNLADKYLNETWSPLYPIETYKESGPDDSPYEEILEDGLGIKSKTRPTFPYNLKELRKESPEFQLLTQTPFGNDLLYELAIAAFDGEEMGKDEWTDFLAISFSSTDKLGHAVGPNSVEIEDMYLRLDKNIEALLSKLDRELGKGQYLVFLTADHGAADVEQYLVDLKIIPNTYQSVDIKAGLKDYLSSYFPGKSLIENISNNQIFFNMGAFADDPKSSGVEYLVASELVRNYLMGLDGISDVFTKNMVQTSAFDEQGVKGNVKRGFHSKRSGDVVFIKESGWTGMAKGTTHGSVYSYDTHVPILFFGYGVKQGTTANYHTITDIAPTVSTILKIKFPSGCTGQPIDELLK